MSEKGLNKKLKMRAFHDGRPPELIPSDRQAELNAARGSLRARLEDVRKYPNIVDESRYEQALKDIADAREDILLDGIADRIKIWEEAGQEETVRNAPDDSGNGPVDAPDAPSPKDVVDDVRELLRTPDKLRVFPGPSGFEIVGEDGTRRPATDEEQEKYIFPHLSGTDPVAGQPVVEMLDELDISSPGGRADVEEEAHPTGSLDDKKHNLRGRLDKVKDKIGDEHFQKLTKFIDDITDDDGVRGMGEALRVYEPKRGRRRRDEDVPPAPADTSPGDAPRNTESLNLQEVLERLPRTMRVYKDAANRWNFLDASGTKLTFNRAVYDRLSDEARIQSEGMTPSVGMPRFTVEAPPPQQAQPGFTPESIARGDDSLEDLLRKLKEVHDRLDASGAIGQAVQDAANEINAEINRQRAAAAGAGAPPRQPPPIPPQERRDAPQGQPRWWRRFGRRNTPPQAPAQAPAANLPLSALVRSPGGHDESDRPRRTVFSMLHEKNATRPDILSMDVIKKDRKLRELFGEFLHEFGNDGLIHKYEDVSEEMSEEDVERLRMMQYEFTSRMALAEEMRKGINKADVAFMMDHNPGFNMLVASINPGRATEILKNQVYRLFMREDDEILANYVTAQREIRRIRTSPKYARLQTQSRNFLRRNPNYTPDDIDLFSSSPNLQAGLLTPNWRDRFSLFRRDTIGNRGDQLVAIDANLRAMGAMLAGTLTGDSKLNLEIRNEGRTGKKVSDIGATEFATHEDAVREQKIVEMKFGNTALMIQEIESPNSEYRRGFRERTGVEYDEADRDTRADDYFEFSGGFARRHEESRGWLATWLNSLNQKIMNDARDNLRETFERRSGPLAAAA